MPQLVTVVGEYKFAGLALQYKVDFSEDLADVIGVRVSSDGENIDSSEIWVRTPNRLKPPIFETLEYHIILAAQEKAQDEGTPHKDQSEKVR